MEEKKRYSTMVFPQGYRDNVLRLHIVLIPRNQDPFAIFNTGLAAPLDTAVSFADLQPSFTLQVVKGLGEWPISNATAPGREPVSIPLTVSPANNKKALLTAIAAQFGAKINSTASAPTVAETSKIEVYKQLPKSYQQAGNFTTPRVKNAKTDDSYRCALRAESATKAGWKNSDDLSWGQVFAFILRQPMLARVCGMIYDAEITLTAENADLFKKGCYIYADVVNEGIIEVQEQISVTDEGPFIKPYAARLPKLKMGGEHNRPLFAPILFPVLYRKTSDGPVDPEPPKAPWDHIFAELNEYNDGFAKIVHAMQPVSTDLVSEEPDGNHPVKDEGIRLAWDDEQILIWYMRQLQGYKENPADPGPGERIDAPLGVYGYRVDVKEDNDAAAWSSLNMVRNTKAYDINGTPVGNSIGEEHELPFQVFPSQLDNDTTAPYWLPLYYLGWTGKSIVLKDADSIAIHENDKGLELDEKGQPKQVEASNLFEEVPAAAPLRYGKAYRFRVRMMDISGGGPTLEDELYNNAPMQFSKRAFKRFIAPGPCRIDRPEELNTTAIEFFNETKGPGDVSVFGPAPVLSVRRPTLNYPAVVFTDKYQQAGLDPVALLIQSVQDQKAAGTELNKVQIHPAIADPDVDRVQIKVEVETLRLDNLASDSGSENYITLYTTTRRFPAGFEDVLSLPVTFLDVPVLNLGSNTDPFNDADLSISDIHDRTDVPLPTARKVRITLRAVCADDQVSNEEYYGLLNDGNPDMDSRYGKITRFFFYKESGDEDDLLLPRPNVPELQGIYLQPDPEYVRRGDVGEYFFFSAETSTQPDIMQRLAQQLRVRVNGLTLVAEKGRRVVFGCNNKIRHHLAPDGSSITFSSKADLCNHWLGCIVYRINRDWSWDGLEDVGFVISREKKFKRDDDTEKEVQTYLGDIEIKHSASFESLQADEFGIVDRSSTTIIFIDSIEPKTGLKRAGSDAPRYPDELQVQYRITPKFKPGHGSEQFEESSLLELPTTINPVQVPKIASVGVAFSKYRKGEKYSYTEARQKYLWVELEEPVDDPHDTLFCRVLHYAPDQMIGNNQQMNEIMQVTEQPPALPVDPEYIRIITPGQTDDMAGLGAMQAMEKAAGNDDLHYLLPLPPGLHSESPELFGFFTYEFRMGHGHWSNEGERPNLWSTAQGRFGRPLTVTGVQHPAPTLLCNVDRDDVRVVVNAPYAKAVWKGKNVTSDPPRTQLHAVLYAQVKQADNQEFRNILLDTRLMELVKPVVKPIRPRVTDFADSAISGAIKSSDIWTIKHTDEIARAQVILSNLTLMNEVTKLKLDTSQTRKINRAMTEFREGKTVRLDAGTAREIVTAFDKLKAKDAIQAQLENVSYTKASLEAGLLIATYKDLPKTARVSWTNKEIGAMLDAMGLPDEASLSVLVVEVFGNITSIIEHTMSVSDEVLEKAGSANDNIQNLVEMILERRRRNRLALTDELGNYRILRTSPLTEVPFVCCANC